MPAPPEKPILPEFSAWGDQLACPVCYQSLLFEKARILCSGCNRTYPMQDGIPALIPDRASQQTS
jgi:uncharacterized protein YbaR (Trm112 family)